MLTRAVLCCAARDVLLSFSSSVAMSVAVAPSSTNQTPTTTTSTCMLSSSSPSTPTVRTDCTSSSPLIERNPKNNSDSVSMTHLQSGIEHVKQLHKHAHTHAESRSMMTEKSVVENKQRVQYRGVRSRVSVHLCTEQDGRSSDECPVCSAGQTAECNTLIADKTVSEVQPVEWCHDYCRQQCESRRGACVRAAATAATSTRPRLL